MVVVFQPGCILLHIPGLGQTGTVRTRHTGRMRHAMLAGALVLLGLATAAWSATPQPEGKARVRLLDTAPVTLRGISFEPLETVRLRLELGERVATRQVGASPTGTFTVRFPAMRYNRCSGSLALTATGREGSRVSWELVPLECPTRLDS